MNAATPKVLGPRTAALGSSGAWGCASWSTAMSPAVGSRLLNIRCQHVRWALRCIDMYARTSTATSSRGASVRCSVTSAGGGSWESDLQAASPVAHILECWRLSSANSRDHLSGRLRALLRRIGRARWIQGCLSTRSEVPCRTIFARGGPAKHSPAPRTLSVAHRRADLEQLPFIRQAETRLEARGRRNVPEVGASLPSRPYRRGKPLSLHVRLGAAPGKP